MKRIVLDCITRKPYETDLPKPVLNIAKLVIESLKHKFEVIK